MPRPLPYAHFPVHYLLDILPFDAMVLESLTVQLSEHTDHAGDSKVNNGDGDQINYSKIFYSFVKFTYIGVRIQSVGFKDKCKSFVRCCMD